MTRIISSINFLIKNKDVCKVMNLFLRYGISYKSTRFVENGDLLITVYSTCEKDVIELFEANNVCFDRLEEKGLFALIKRNKHRTGIFWGVLFLIIALFMSSKFVWEINIIGNENLSDDEIVTELKQSGFYVGSYIPGIKYKELHNRVLLNFEEIGWISINIRGNVANVSVKESVASEEKKTVKYSNIIAKNDGQIAIINVYDGKKQVSLGDVVKKGDLLISGIIDSNAEGERFVDAKGTVTAYVNKQIIVDFPYENVTSIEIKKQNLQKKYKIFNKVIFFSINNNKCSSICDTIEKTEQIKLFGKINLPIYKIITNHIEYEQKSIVYSTDQAIDLALKELKQKLDVELKNCELLSKDIKVQSGANGIRISCQLCCLEDIGKSIEFIVEDNGG